MTVKQLKAALQNLPDHMDVFIKQTNDEYGCSLVEHATAKEIEFFEDSGPALSKDTVFLLTDDND